MQNRSGEFLEPLHFAKNLGFPLQPWKCLFLHSFEQRLNVIFFL
jgi:hypothetical protein